MMSPGSRAAGMRPHPPPPSLAWRLQHALRKSLPPHRPPSNHMTPMSSKNLRRCGHRFRARPMRAHAHPPPLLSGGGVVIIVTFVLQFFRACCESREARVFALQGRTGNTVRSNSAGGPTPLAVLPREFQIWVADAVVPGKRVGAAERLLLGTHIAADLLLPCVVDGILVPCQIVGS